MSIEQFIDNEVKSNDVVLFMKGTPQFPQCGFSGQVVQILDHVGVGYKGLNVLESADLLQTLVSETERVNSDARQLVADLADAQLNWKPAPNAWSIAQCLEHLAVTSEKFDQDFARALAFGREKRSVSGAVRYRPTIFGGWLVKRLSPEAKRKMPAPKVFRPSENSAIEGALERFLTQQETFLGFVKDARNRLQ